MFEPNPCNDAGERLDFGHLGGTCVLGDQNSWYPELWVWLIAKFDVRTMLDIGCGVGFAQKFFADRDVYAFGIDCEQVLAHHIMTERTLYTKAHDLTESAIIAVKPYDLVWCCEVAEHIEKEFEQNIVDTLVKSCKKVLAFSAAAPGNGGYHHVNCQGPEYWANRLSVDGLVYSAELTGKARALCTGDNGRRESNYFARTGLIFTREN